MRFNIIYLLLGIITIATILFYTSKFGIFGFSSHTDSWGQFGDYFGGILNPVIAVFNLIILIRITKIVKDEDEGREKRQLHLNKEMGLLNLRYEEFKNYKKSIDTHLAKEDFLSNSASFVDLLSEFKSLNERIEFIIPEIAQVKNFTVFRDHLQLNWKNWDGGSIEEKESLNIELREIYGKFIQNLGHQIVTLEEQKAQ